MGLIAGIRRLIRGSEPTLVDYEAGGMPAEAGAYAPEGETVVGRVGMPAAPDPGAFKIQQSYDSLLETVRDLREALDGQTRRQEELLSRLSTLPAAAETLPQTSALQADMLKMINERVAVHAQQQRKMSEILAATDDKKKVPAEIMQSLRDQIEMSNEIDRQLVESFNRFSVMIDRLQSTNAHAVECLQQVRDSYSHTAFQMQDWVEKSRQRSTWLLTAAFAMSALALTGVVVLLYMLTAPSR